MSNDLPLRDEDPKRFLFPQVLVVPGVVCQLDVVVDLGDSVDLFLVIFKIDMSKGLFEPALPPDHVFGEHKKIVDLEEGLDEDVLCRVQDQEVQV